jgi:hypothetical protein
MSQRTDKEKAMADSKRRKNFPKNNVSIQSLDDLVYRETIKITV